MPYKLDTALLKKVLDRHGYLRTGEEIQVELLGGGVSNNAPAEPGDQAITAQAARADGLVRRPGAHLARTRLSPAGK
jgi:hypothetical protein